MLKQIGFWGSYFFLIVLGVGVTAYLGCVLFICFSTLPFLAGYCVAVTFLFSFIRVKLWRVKLPFGFLSFAILAPCVAFLLFSPVSRWQMEQIEKKQALLTKKAAAIHHIQETEHSLMYTGEDYGIRFVLPKPGYAITEKYTLSAFLADTAVPDGVTAYIQVTLPDGRKIDIISQKNYTNSMDVFENFPGLTWLDKDKPTIQLTQETIGEKPAHVLRQVYNVSETKDPQLDEVSLGVYILTPKRKIEIRTQYPKRDEAVSQQYWQTFLQQLQIVD